MKLDIFRQLKRKFENKDFEHDNLYIDRTLYYSSWFGNLLSIVLAFFFVSTLVGGSAVHFAGQAVILPIFIVLFLTAFELLKRFVFGNVTTAVLTSKKFAARTFAGILFALMLVSASFYLSLSGAKYYVNKNETIVANIDSITTAQSDSISKEYQGEISKVEQKIAYTYDAAKLRKRKALTQDELLNIKAWEQDIKDLKKERDFKIEEFKKEIEQKQGTQIDKSEKSQFAFVLLSAFIELLILIGVGYRQFYTFTCFQQKKEVLEGNPNYKKLELYSEMMQVLFNNGKIAPSTQLPAFNRFKELVNSKTRIRVPDRMLKEFLTLMNHLEITYTSGRTRYTGVSYEKAQETLENYINIDA